MKKVKKIKKHNLFIRILKKTIKRFRTKPEIVQKTDILPERAIYIANHSGAAGPLTLSLYFPKILVPWGAYPMTGHYIRRWKYLYFVFYRQKLHYNKVRSFILATLFGIISKLLYKGVKLVPTYPDFRMRKSFSKSIEHLKIGNSLLIFPEDSNEGYDDEIKTFQSGFIYLASMYYKEVKSHIPIIPVYYNKSKKIIKIGKHYLLSDFSSNLHRNQLAQLFKNELNSLA